MRALTETGDEAPRDNGSMRHLTESQASSALRRGRQIDQLLGREQLPDERWAIRWLTISPTGSRFVISRHHVEDIGGVEFADVAEFPPINPDEYVGEGAEVASAPNADEALALAIELGAAPDRWVNFGVLRGEYLDSRSPI